MARAPSQRPRAKAVWAAMLSRRDLAGFGVFDAAQPAPMPGSDVDAHGCKGSAGYQWSEELKQCVRPWLSRAITLDVAPQRRTCTGVIEMQCLMVREWVREREPGQAAPRWEPLFGSIAGFKHVPGKHYTLRVRKDKLENPPADAPSITYTLLKVVR